MTPSSPTALERLQQLALKQYPAFVTTAFQGQSFFPLQLSIKLPNSYPELAHLNQLLHAASREQCGYGYRLHYETIQSRRLGTQTVPVAAIFDTPHDFLHFTDKLTEWEQFQQVVQHTELLLPALLPWVREQYALVMRYAPQWNDLLLVVAFFLQNTDTGLYLRQLPLPVSTKFVEQHKGIVLRLLALLRPELALDENTSFEQKLGIRTEPAFVRFLVLDPLLAARYLAGFQQLMLPLSDFEALPWQPAVCFVIENKTSIYPFLSMPSVSRAVAIWGSGYGAVQLRHVGWLRHCRLLYWGDIDAHGFEILAQWRQYFPHTESLLMHQSVFAEYAQLSIAGKESRLHAPPVQLTDDELALYNYIVQNNLRLEQEKITHQYLLQEFQRINLLSAR